MSVFKKIDNNDITITPFDVHKEYILDASTYSSSYGAQVLGANYHSYSFADPIRGKNINLESKNLNGTYKSIIYDSVNHLYYKNPDNPNKNFGGNLPERETRFLGEKAHIISVPSTIYDLRILSGSINFKDHFIETLPLDREKLITASSTVYNTPPLIANHWEFESSQSGLVDLYGTTRLQQATSSIPSEGAGFIIQTGSQALVGTGSIMFKVHAYDTVTGRPGSNLTHSYNAGNGLQLKPATDFTGSNVTNWWTYEGGQALGNNASHGMPVYNITMWVKPPDWNEMPNKVTGAPGQSTIITRDKNAYFELNMLTSSYDSYTNNPKGLLPLQMHWGATGSNATDSTIQAAIDKGFGLATGSWNLISVQQEFWPGDAFLGTSGSQYQELPPWGHSPAKTTLRIFRPDPNNHRGYTVIKQVGYATQSIEPGTANLPSHSWSNEIYRAVTSSIQYDRSLYVGASGSYSLGAAQSANPGVNTKMNAFTGSMDDIRFYESSLTDTHLTTLYKHPYLRLDQIAPMTASFDLLDDGYGNFIDKGINSNNFVSESNLVGYYGFNELFTILNQTSGSSDILLHRGLGPTKVKDLSTYKNHGISDKVKYTPGIAVFAQSGSIRSADSINYYQSSVQSGIRAQFNNSGSIKIPHHTKLNLGHPRGFAISFWVKIPENQIPGINTILRTERYETTGAGGNAGGTRIPCFNMISGSTAGRDYVTLITKTGLSNISKLDNSSGQYFQEFSNKGVNDTYPYNIELKNTHFQQDGEDIEYCESNKINTLVVRRSDGKKTTVLESKLPLAPLVDNHIVLEKAGDVLNLWINGKLDRTVVDSLGCTDNESDIFLGDDGLGWVTGSNITHTFPYPVKPFSGSLDEIRFYNTSLTEGQVLSLYDNSWKESTAYQEDAVGNTFYEQGLLSLTNTNYPRYFSGSLHEGTATIGNSSAAIFSENFKLSLKNTRRIYEHKIKCHTKASDFNLSLNPTLLKPIIDECGNVTNSEELRDFATKPEFNPYLTTVGLYDEFGRMLAVAKLAKPIQKLQNVDMTFVVRFDR